MWRNIIFLSFCLVSTIFAQKIEKEYQSFDGWFNSPIRGDWGSHDWRMGSRMFPAYGDGVYNPALQTGPNPVTLSESLFINPQPEQPAQSLVGRTVLSAFMGQHLWHEILDQYKMQCSPEAFFIPVPPGDPFMDPDNRGDVFIPFWRARYDIRTGQAPNTPRFLINEETSWIDGSSIYGLYRLYADFLREHKDGVLKCIDPLVCGQSNENIRLSFPAVNTIGLPMINLPPPREHALKDSRRLFRFGNRRAHENPGIFALMVLWFRNHNFHALQFRNQLPGLTDEQYFMLARQRNIAELQHVLLDLWLPDWMGQVNPLGTYVGWESSTAPGVTTEFSIALRYGETMLPPGFFRQELNCVNTNNFTSPADGVSRIAARLCNLYWNAIDIIHDGVPIDNLIFGMVSQTAEAEDQFFTEDVRQFAYGPLEFSRRDLMAVHIQRQRDFGIPDFNTVRKNYGLLQFSDFNNFTANIGVANLARDLYFNNISNVDLFVGGMLESLGGPGETFSIIFIDVLQRIRNADRFWYENTLTGFFNDTEIEQIRAVTMNDIITRTTNIPQSNLQANIFRIQGAVCPIGIVLAPQLMEPCTPLQTFDYFGISYASIPLIALAVVIYIFLMVVILYLLVLRRQGFKLRQMTEQIMAMNDETLPDGTKLHAAVEELVEDKIEKQRPVYLGIKQNKLQIFDDKKKPAREVDRRLIEGVVMAGSRDLAKLLIKIPKEYDILVSFGSHVNRHEFMVKLKGDRDILMENASERHVKNTMKTKDQRKKELKKFFNQAIQAIVSRGNRSEVNLPQEVYEQEMSRDEFAEAFSIAKGSLFVQQLFDLVDKDRSGYVSFREFLDFMGVFYNGSSEEKLTFLFDLYDTEKTGAISREALAKMLKSNMEIANAQYIEKDSVNQMVNLIFDQMGLGPNDKIKFKDFKDFMGKTGQVITVAPPKQYVDKSDKKDDKKPQTQQPTVEDFNRGATFIANQAMIKGLEQGNDNVQSYTVLFTPEDIKKLREGDSSNAAPLNNLTKAYSASAPKETIEAKVASVGVELDSKNKFVAYIRDNRSSIFILAMYVFAGALIFGERAYTYTVAKEHAGLRRLAGFGVTTTRGAASAMMFNFAFLLATMTRNIFTKVRSGTFFGVPLHHYIPFDNIYIFHKLVALIGLFWVAVHVTGHFINFFHINTQPADNLACVFREVYHLSFDLPVFTWWLFATVTGFSGAALVFVIITMYIFSAQYSRRHVFAAFWTTHHVCAVLLYIGLVLHGSGRLVQQPIFYIFFMPPAALFLFDRMLTVGRSAVKVPVIEAELLPSQVTKIIYKRPDDFEYKAGQWIRIACVAISENEFHPFTLTSAPHEKHLSNYIRSVGPWTNALRETYDPKRVRLSALPELYIDGPYGEGHQDWNSFEYVVLVGGGIGVTPFAALLKDIVHQIQNNRTIYMKKCYFFWVCRNQKQFEWLVDIIRECENKDPVGILEVHIFITELQQKYDLRTTMLHVCERTFQKISKKSLFTGCRALTHFGRPNFVNLFEQMQKAHATTSKIGVFSCGPPAMTLNVDDGAIEANKREGPRFHHHFENF